MNVRMAYTIMIMPTAEEGICISIVRDNMGTKYSAFLLPEQEISSTQNFKLHSTQSYTSQFSSIKRLQYI